MTAPILDDTLNESPPFVDVNLFMSDRVFQETVAREGAAWAAFDLEVFGGVAGSAAAIELGRTANEHPPHAPAFVSDAFLSLRLAGNASQTYGAQQGAVDDEGAILDRAGPTLG